MTTDMAPTIVPNSLQLNADDLLVGPITIKITDVKIVGGEQPVSISYVGDEGKPFKPSKSMRRVMVMVWGPDAAKYKGRSMTLYREPTVKYGGFEVGGIRISHLSHLEEKVTLALAETRKARKPFTVLPLVIAEPSPPPAPERDKVADGIAAMIARLPDLGTHDELDAFKQSMIKQINYVRQKRPELHKAWSDAVDDWRPMEAAGSFEDEYGEVPE